MDYSDRQVIVTGGTGALGSAVVGVHWGWCDLLSALAAPKRSAGISVQTEWARKTFRQYRSYRRGCSAGGCWRLWSSQGPTIAWPPQEDGWAAGSSWLRRWVDRRRAPPQRYQAGQSLYQGCEQAAYGTVGPCQPCRSRTGKNTEVTNLGWGLTNKRPTYWKERSVKW